MVRTTDRSRPPLDRVGWSGARWVATFPSRQRPRSRRHLGHHPVGRRSRTGSRPGHRGRGLPGDSTGGLPGPLPDGVPVPRVTERRPPRGHHRPFGEAEQGHVQSARRDAVSPGSEVPVSVPASWGSSGGEVARRSGRWRRATAVAGAGGPRAGRRTRGRRQPSTGVGDQDTRAAHRVPPGASSTGTTARGQVGRCATACVVEPSRARPRCGRAPIASSWAVGPAASRARAGRSRTTASRTGTSAPCPANLPAPRQGPAARRPPHRPSRSAGSRTAPRSPGRRPATRGRR